MIQNLIITFIGIWVAEIFLFTATLPVGGAAGVAGATAKMVAAFTGAFPALFWFNLTLAVLWVVGGAVGELQAMKTQRVIDDNLLAGHTCNLCGFYKKGWIGGSCTRNGQKVRADETCVSWTG